MGRDMSTGSRCLSVCLSFPRPPPPQVDRVSYLLQEIYGIENKNNQETKVGKGTLTLPLPRALVSQENAILVVPGFSVCPDDPHQGWEGALRLLCLSW